MNEITNRGWRTAGWVLGLLVAMTVPTALVQAMAVLASGATAPVVCAGPHDLSVEKGPVTLQGTQTYDRVCVQNGGTLVVSGALTLRAGILYVAADGAIIGNGADGHDYATHDCIGNDVQVDGSPGASLTIIARHAVIAGHISINGGKGLDYGPYCDGITSIGRGGAAGSVTLTALDVTLPLTGHVTARGGAGGNAGAHPGFGVGPSSATSGDGGKGGQITIAVAHPDPAMLRTHLDVSGGAAGTPGTGPTGSVGVTGTVLIRSLTAAERASLPAEPAPPITFIGAAPSRQPLDPSLAQSPEMRCGPSDLIVRRGQAPVLSGVHQYAHVCVQNGGALIGRGSLTLIAQTIAIAPRGRITLDGASPMPFHWSDSGQYDARGACLATHLPPHAGVPGAAGSLADIYSGSTGLSANPGGGGGVLTLIAGSTALDGRISAAGGSGQDGQSDPNYGHYGPKPLGGAGGGSGGGVLVVTQRLQLGGTVTVAGGDGGRGNGIDANGFPAAAGQSGSAGCIKIFTDMLRAPVGPLSLIGPAIVGQPLPSDPVAPSTGTSGSLYFPQTRHTLSGPFLYFWQREGGVATFGYPQSEPFHEGGRLVQYTDRFRLDLIAGGVQTAPLGRLLTAQRRFARVAPIASTPIRLYFPGTGHTLSGPFLDYWRAHDGAALLGAPISEVTYEGNDDGTGRRYRLQWFERGRLEYHAEMAGTRGAVALGLLGIQTLQQRGWLAPFSPSPGGPSLDEGASPTTHLYAVAGGETTFSADGSRQWHYLWSGPPPTSGLYGNTSSIVGLATADADRTIYAGTYGGDLWQSDDWGHTWHADQGLPGGNEAILGFAVAPNQRTVYADSVQGIYKSTDAGATWNVVLTPTESSYETQGIALDHRQPNHLWVGTYGDGIYRTVDAGQTWVHVQGHGFPANAEVYAIAVSPASSVIVYVATNKGLYHTGDGGVHWTFVDGPWGQGLSGGVGEIALDPLQARHIYVGANGGVYVSHDNGASWDAGAGLSQGGSIVVSHGHPGVAYLANGSIYRTTDGGLTWQQWNGGDIPNDDVIYQLAGDVS